MALKAVKRREWTKDDVRELRTLAREKTKVSVIARKLKRTEGATRQKARSLNISLRSVKRKRKVCERASTCARGLIAEREARQHALQTWQLKRESLGRQSLNSRALLISA
jgi:hypothetical protein